MRSPKIYSEVGIPETPWFGICPRSYEVTQILVKNKTSMALSSRILHDKLMKEVLPHFMNREINEQIN